MVTPPLMLTIVVDTVDETDSHLSMVVGHEDNVKNIFAIGIQLPKPLVHSLQGLGGRESKDRVRVPGNDEWSWWLGIH